MSGGSLRSLLMKRSNSIDIRDGIDFGDAERVAHGRVRGRSASLAEDVLAARERDDVLHGEEVRLVGELGEQAELVLDQLADLRRCGRAAERVVAAEHRCFIYNRPLTPTLSPLVGGEGALRRFAAALSKRVRGHSVAPAPAR